MQGVAVLYQSILGGARERQQGGFGPLEVWVADGTPSERRACGPGIYSVTGCACSRLIGLMGRELLLTYSVTHAVRTTQRGSRVFSRGAH